MTSFPIFPDPSDPANPDPDGPRYAIYFMPAPGSPLAELGADWLARDCASGETRPAPSVPGIEAGRLAELTESARFYGFHATLKPPFHLKPGHDQDQLAGMIERLAMGQTAFDVTLGLRSLGGFLALMITPPDYRMDALADACVRDLDAFRALPNEQELARRRDANLSAQQEALLQQWGYPYVMGEFRFHMTLSARLTDDAERALLWETLSARAAPVVAKPVTIDAIALFHQPSRGEPFNLVRRFPFAA
ncbi:MAG: DUF1045 domain-containing protein [Alphaproteobacteria bacterium]|nr:DUF1045 domain-containing protein [Alphaproteobacteria bacterium]